MYNVIRNILFKFDPEKVHESLLSLCHLLGHAPPSASILSSIYRRETPELAIKLGTLTFPNPVGLAAGYDKDAMAILILQALGFGFLEVGTVTPLSQEGNPKKRLFRLPEDKAIINRMGFNNKGIDHLILRLSEARPQITIPIGVNLGKNKVTPMEKAVDDYLTGLEKAWEVADYFTINISSPNTQNLRDLHEKETLDVFVAELMNRRDEISDTSPKKPVWLKIAPDLTEAEIESIADIALKNKIDALIISNTTISRNDLHHPSQIEMGGLSGKPLKSLSNDVLRKMYRYTKGQVPLIGVGGIFNAEDAFEKIRLGASMVQVFTGLVYEGPAFIHSLTKGLKVILQREGFTSVTEAIGCANQ